MKPSKIYAVNLEQSALDQFEAAMALDTVVAGALMPDAHTGYTLPIGAVIAVKDFVYPSFVGYDIGCGMCAVPTDFKKKDIMDYATVIFNRIYREVPVGFAHNKRDTDWDWKDILHTEALANIFEKNGLKQLGSLGSGNHFIEIGCDETDRVWVVVHSGSRGIGHSVASFYMRLASGDGKAREGHYGFSTNSVEGHEYLMDQQFCLRFALANRYELILRVLSAIQHYCGGVADWQHLINRNHNHAEYKEGLWIHRKGATHAEDGMMGVIPGNMRDGTFIVKGKGNPDSLCSSSHGAGRAMGRKKAQDLLTLDQFKTDMRGVAAMVGLETLDESPRAYKDIHEVMELQADLIEVQHHIRPIINIKG